MAILVHMNDAIKLISASLASFALTTLYLQHHQPRRPAPSGAHAPVIAASPLVTNSRVATGYRPPATVPKAAPQTISYTPELSADEAEAERRELEEFFGGVMNVAPISPQQKEALLQAKLRHEKSYAATLKDAGITRESLSEAERVYAHKVAAQAIADFRNNFLIDVRPVLSEEQYTLLSDFEDTEYSRRLAQLQIEINAK